MSVPDWSSEPITSPEFQRLTGYLVALELGEDMPGLQSVEMCFNFCKAALARLGEPGPTQYEIVGMRDFYDEVPLICYQPKEN